MSEYQYYEFLAIDRPLTGQEQAAISRLSSRVRPTSSRAVFTYNYSDFPATEPPVPPGLRQLSAPLQEFMALIEIDPHLYRVAAEASADRQAAPADELRRAIGRLPRGERDDFLVRLARGEPGLTVALNRRLGELMDAPQQLETPRRTVGQLLAAAEQARQAERERGAREAEARRIEAFQALAQREGQVWQEIETLIQQSKARPYDEAVRLLGQLQELAVYQGQQAASRRA